MYSQNISLRRVAIFRSMLPFVLAIAGFGCVEDSLQGETVDFERDVYSVFQRSCFECHGEDKQEGGLRLDVKSDLLDSGVVELRSPNESELVRRIELPRNHEQVMPVIGDPLSKSEVASIRAWIASGADWPDDFVPPRHWSYIAPVRSEVPKIDDARWSAHPIDCFVKAKLDAIDLSPSPQANRSVLLRRLYLDLIGLPPTLDEIHRFEADRSADALEHVIDDLLSRPQFGERWARPWLDLARYADSHGFQRDDFRDTWAYRDWVIRALNDDMPFDQFTIEQIAGDLLPSATQNQIIATGFHRCSPTNVEAGSLPEETRIEQVLDRVNTTATVWLGSTLECAQCHDHKFDPFSTKDYYRLLAFFNNTKIEADRKIPKSPSSIAFIGASINIADETRDRERRSLNQMRAKMVAQRDARREDLKHDLNDWVVEARAVIAKSSQSHPMEVIDFSSAGNTDSFTIRDDGAVLLVGSDPPVTDTYLVTATLNAADVRAFRLDVLTDPSLPGSGPGRGDEKRTNFVLNEFSVSRMQQDDLTEPLEFATANADFSQAGYQVTGAVDGVAKSGWAISPQFSRPHWATFVLSQPLDASGGVTLRFTIDQRFGGARTIGCFRLSAVSGNLDAKAVPKEIAALLESEPDSWTKKQTGSIVDYRATVDPAIGSITRRIEAVDRQLRDLAAETTQVMVELKTPRESFVFNRGDYRSPGEKVTPGTPEFLHPTEAHDSNEALNRLDLAHWLVDPSNPLVARVTVNRYWAELFGAGLVRTPEDFGIKGDRPTHPALLDWLAIEFIENGWSLKRLLKTIVTSETYQQSSATSSEVLQLDDPNRFLARGPRVRLDAEMIRDNALTIAGLISPKSFGPPVHPYQPDGLWTKVGGQKYDYVVSPGDEKYRRGVYVVIKRGAPYPSFVNFDADSRFACTVQRSRSNTPLQALTLLNDPVYVEAAKAIAMRASQVAKNQSLESTVIDELRRCITHQPEPKDVAAMVRLIHSQLDAFKNAPDELRQRADRLTSDVELPAGVGKDEFVAWFGAATVMLNLHETITKE